LHKLGKSLKSQWQILLRKIYVNNGDYVYKAIINWTNSFIGRYEN